MNRNEISRFIQSELKERWPEWNPTNTQITDIQSWFDPYTFDQARIAAKQVRAENGYKIPDLGRIARLCRSMVEQRRSSTYIHCYGVFENGRFYTVVIEISGLIEFDDENSLKVRRSAERFFLDIGNDYGFNCGVVVFVGEKSRAKALEYRDACLRTMQC